MDYRPLNDFIVHLLAHLLAEEELSIHAQPSVMLRLEALPIGSLTISISIVSRRQTPSYGHGPSLADVVVDTREYRNVAETGDYSTD